MTLGEKTAAVTGGELSPDKVKRPSSGVYAFSDVVDEACKGLMDKKIKHSIRRIQEMEESLCDLERELDVFLSDKDRKMA
ncbi:MAG: hypothetical protein FWD22_04140 [Treponema sp.]|nr:hypothetical protein [Treponema sp.]